jgi:hypothetical protein
MKFLGKIKAVRLGYSDYNNLMFGFFFDLVFVDGDTTDFWGTWSSRHESCKWTEEERATRFLTAFLRVKRVMEDAGVDDFNKLAGVPIEVELDRTTLISWRILREVL